MKINAPKDKKSYIPDSAYLIFQYFRFFFLDDSEDRKNLANDRIKRFQAIINERLHQGVDITDVSMLLQLTLYFFDFMYIGNITKEDEPPFLPNICWFINYDVCEPILKITKSLIDKKFFTPDSGMLFENKFLIGFENRIYDGMPIPWNGDLNSLVTLIYLLILLGKIKTNDNFDTMAHRKRQRRNKNTSHDQKGLVLPNITTLICGKYIDSKKEKIGQGNFLINGENSYKYWHKTNRRCKGINKQFMLFFQEKSNDEILDCIINNKDELIPDEATKKDEQISSSIVDLVCDCYRKPNTSYSHKKTLFSR
jgi:hypothetical protein